MKTFLLLGLVGFAVCASTPARAQTIDDGIMLTAHSLQTGGIYARDSWDEYWEGTLKRVNAQHQHDQDADGDVDRRVRPIRIRTSR